MEKIIKFVSATGAGKEENSKYFSWQKMVVLR
jgi:hypothetical protein